MSHECDSYGGGLGTYVDIVLRIGHNKDTIEKMLKSLNQKGKRGAKEESNLTNCLTH